MRTSLPVENGNTLKTLQDFLGKLLREGVVDALLVPMRTPSGTVTPALVTNPEFLSAADPLAPVLPVNGANLAGKLSIRQPRPRVGVVLRSCELRALVELTKLKQAGLEDLKLIAVDCAGTYSVPVYQKRVAGFGQEHPECIDNGSKQENLWQELFNQLRASTPGVFRPEKATPELRKACQMCEQPVYEQAEYRIELFGSDLTQEIGLTLPDDVAQKLGYSASSGQHRPGVLPGEHPDAKATDAESLRHWNTPDVLARRQVVEKLVAARTAARDSEFTDMRARLEGKETISGVFAACIRCHNCMTVCPICYCKTCVFKSPLFDHDPMQYMTWTRQKGALRMPSDTMLFHLTRLNHMVLSCVGCGMCTEACPAELPVGTVFRAIGQRVQATFEYLPGRSLEEPLPLITFKADEWSEVGE